MRIINADKFLAYLIFSKHIDELSCGEVKEAIEMCKVDVLDKIRAEITAIAINGQVDEHTAFIRTGEQVKQMAVDILDKYMTESEDKNGREEGSC